MLVFMRNLLRVKIDKAAAAGIEALVRWDPKSASEAELRPTRPEQDDTNIAAALAVAAGKPAAAQSLCERLAAVKAH